MPWTEDGRGLNHAAPVEFRQSSWLLFQSLAEPYKSQITNHAARRIGPLSVRLDTNGGGPFCCAATGQTMRFDSLSWSILSFLLGTVFGHWLSLNRDRRKEFNELADKIFLDFGTQATAPTPFKGLPFDEIILLRRHMGWLQRSRFDAAVSHYEKTAEE